ncbi:dihydrolipoyl dehydrogenase [Candidatus Micrarchaeota archaeon]|nr:dihydrolipoyl dehydrogenase [Candidatus Micrarchaeota archaeon]
MKKFDIIIIGSGAGSKVMRAALAQGYDIGYVEEGPMGGTCLNKGCIPTKILIHSADVIQTIRKAPVFGISAKIESIDFLKAMKRSWKVDNDSKKIEDAVAGLDDVTLYRTAAKFTAPKTIKAGDEEITADKIVIAAGTRPAIPPVKGLDSVPYMTSDGALRLEELPPELIILGGGYIAVELAHFFGSMGSKIKILQRNVRLIPNEDREVGEKFTELFSKQYEVHLNFDTVRAEKSGGRIVVHSRDGRFVEGTHLLVATGRVPNTDTLEVEKAGVRLSKKGYVETNEYMETSVEGIWALGDIAGEYLFRHSANYEADIVSYNIFHPDRKIKRDYTAMPHAIFSYPQIAGVGLTEQDLEGKEYKAGKLPYIKSAMGEALEEHDGFVKFLAAPDNTILGCHIMGPEASTVIHEVLVAMRTGNGKLDAITDTIHIHPALSEIIDRAARTVR